MPKGLTGRLGGQTGSAQGPKRVQTPAVSQEGEIQEEEVGGDCEMWHLSRTLRLRWWNEYLEVDWGRLRRQSPVAAKALRWELSKWGMSKASGNRSQSSLQGEGTLGLGLEG